MAKWHHEKLSIGIGSAWRQWRRRRKSAAYHEKRNNGGIERRGEASGGLAKYQHGVMAKWHRQWHKQRNQSESEIISGACGMATAAS
jgi:hypothetical protein